MRNFNLHPLYRTTVGFDHVFSVLDQLNSSVDKSNYPPYNIEREDENSYRITMAVAGFSEDDLDLEVKENTLTVTGNTSDADDEVEMLHRGIAARSFRKQFKLADYVEVRSAELKNGLLFINLYREIPEVMKPKKIAISGSSSATKSKTIESDSNLAIENAA